MLRGRILILPLLSNNGHPLATDRFKVLKISWKDLKFWQDLLNSNGWLTCGAQEEVLC